ncbi:hypothetical protein Aperf_G00000053755 [Anoplocephala perfoliata]
MDSDSTIPCLDEISARLYEMDDVDESSYQNLSDLSDLDDEKSLSTVVKQSKARASTLKKSSSKHQLTTSAKRTRPVRQSRRPTRVSDVYTDIYSDDDSTTTSSPAFTVRTRTRTSYQNSRTSLTLEDVMTASEKGDSEVATPSSAVASSLTPEQLEIRQRRIERRRESAKNKAEKEMQETVERLLRVNTDYGDNGNNGRGRTRRGPVGVESDSEDSNGEKKKRNALHPSLPLDPPPGSIRFISSQRIQPHCVIALPAESGSGAQLDLLHRSQKAPLPQKIRLCDQCKLAPRKYACSRTGRSLCSLECFKAC